MSVGPVPMRIWTYFILLAATVSSYDAIAEKCTDKPECWPEGSAMHTGLLLAEQKGELETRLARKNRELISLVSQNDRIGTTRVADALAAQHDSWLKYRADECELIGALTGAGGTWPSTYAVRCEVNLTDQRLRRVRWATRCIVKSRKENRAYEEYDCLQQLAPLVNG